MMAAPGSKTAKAIECIKSRGSARSREICEACGIDKNAIGTLLRPYVQNGTLLACKVEVPGSPPQNEYRMGSGIPSLASRPELRPNSHKPSLRDLAIGTRPGPAPAAETSVATKPVALAAQVSRIELPHNLSINEHGELRYQLDGKQHHLTPAQTAALGTFLMKTEGLWRPA